MKKVAFILLFVITISLSLYNVTYATTLDDIMTGGKDFIDAKDDEIHTGIKWEGITNASDLIYNSLLILGIVIAVIVAAVLGIKFMVSSVEEQAKNKESLVPFVIGCIVIFGAFGIWKIVTNIVGSL